MRLINIHTLQLTEFEDSKVPPYCVASHRWTDDEITYEEFVSPHADELAGFVKVRNFCNAVASLPVRDRFNIEYLWIDTCCIDKRSSAELAKSINCMFRWYHEAEFCLAYLADVRHLCEGKDAVYSDFERSAWFKRGWTLQELIAPAKIVFLNSTWEPFETKARAANRIERITGIPYEILDDFRQARNLSVDEKWKWLGGRETKLPEDMAYCMLGIFGVFMPLIYGEGIENARTRLDEEIQRQSRRQMRRQMEGAWRDATISCLDKSPSRHQQQKWPPMAMLGQGSDSFMASELQERRTNNELFEEIDTGRFYGSGYQTPNYEPIDREWREEYEDWPI